MDGQYPAPLQTPPSVSPAAGMPPADPFRAECKRIFITWEKLRLVYNGLLAVETVALLVPLWPHVMPKVSVLLSLVFPAVAANLCFFAGPCVEAYAAWLDRRPKWLTGLLFAAGTIFSVGLTWLFVQGTVGPFTTLVF